MLFFIFSIIFLVINCQPVIREDQIAKIVTLNETSFVTYNSTTSKCRIDCADADTMSLPNFRGMEKVWMFNGTEMFSADDKTFIDSNRSLEFQVLIPEDAGFYMCCVRDNQLAYQSYICYSTELVVVNEEALVDIASTEPPLPPSWNIMVQEGAEIHAQPESNYFLKIFDDNVTDVKCVVNQVPVDIKMNNAFPTPLFNDVLIKNFNVTEHSGLYVCNATITDGNETISEQVTFKISESWAENRHAALLEDAMVREALANTQFTPTHTFFILILSIVYFFN